MNAIVRVRYRFLIVSAMFTIGGMWLCPSAIAQQDAGATDDERVTTLEERVTIQPYTGPPIFLDEPEVIAPPTIVDRETRSDRYDDGTIRVERQIARYSDNHFEADGFYREYYPNGQLFVEGQFRNGRQHGEWAYWFANGQLNRRVSYVNGQPDGAWEVFREDGTLAATHGFREGLRHGEWITYDDSGQQPIREEHYDEGKYDGIIKAWHPNGQLRVQMAFRQGERHGVSMEWDEQGELRAEVNYVDGKLDGTATIRLPNGDMLVQEYDDGRLISESR